MRYTKKSIIIFTLSILFFAAPAQTVKNISAKDFKNVLGKWQGSLTYLDYSSGKPYTMAANIVVTILGKSNTIIFSNIYPKEPKANSVDTLTISKDGNKINNEPITSRKKLSDGSIEIITETPGKDGNDNKPALIRNTYNLGTALFVMRKDVQFTGQAEWIKRHAYKYTKKL